MEAAVDLGLRQLLVDVGDLPQGVRDAPPSTVRLQIAHPTRAGQDRVVTLTRGPADVYVGVIAPRPAGRWLVSVETDLWKLPATPAPDGLAEVHLGAVRSTD